MRQSFSMCVYCMLLRFQSTLVWANQGNFFENAIACSKRTLKTGPWKRLSQRSLIQRKMLKITRLDHLYKCNYYCFVLKRSIFYHSLFQACGNQSSVTTLDPQCEQLADPMQSEWINWNFVEDSIQFIFYPKCMHNNNFHYM